MTGRELSLPQRRHRALVAAGASRGTAGQAARGCRSAAGFLAVVAELGRSPSDFEAELYARRDRPRVMNGSAESLARAKRYRELRDLGASSAFASEYKHSAWAFEQGKKLLAARKVATR